MKRLFLLCIALLSAFYATALAGGEMIYESLGPAPMAQSNTALRCAFIGKEPVL